MESRVTIFSNQHTAHLVRFLLILIISFIFLTNGLSAGSVNLLPNPGFESGGGDMPDNWLFVSRKDRNTIQWITDDVHSGKKAMKLTANVPEDDGKSMGIYTDFLPMQENVRLEMSAWIKAQNIMSPGNWYKGRIVLYAFDKAKEKIKHSEIELDGSITDWAKIRQDMITPQGTNFIKVSFWLTSCTGKMWIDDVEVSVAQEVPKVNLDEFYNPVIIPQPWKIRYGNGQFAIASVAIVAEPRLGEQTCLKEEIKEFFDKIDIPYSNKTFAPGDKGIENYGTQLLIGDGSNTIINNQFSAKFSNKIWEEIGDQGYFLSI